MKPYWTVEKEIWEEDKRKKNEAPVRILSISEEVRIQLGIINDDLKTN